MGSSKFRVGLLLDLLTYISILSAYIPWDMSRGVLFLSLRHLSIQCTWPWVLTSTVSHTLCWVLLSNGWSGWLPDLWPLRVTGSMQECSDLITLWTLPLVCLMSFLTCLHRVSGTEVSCGFLAPRMTVYLQEAPGAGEQHNEQCLALGMTPLICSVCRLYGGSLAFQPTHVIPSDI